MEFKDIQNLHQSRSKNKLVFQNAVTWAHGSCTIRVMGSWAPVYTNNPDLGGGRRKEGKVGGGEGREKRNGKRRSSLDPQPPSLPSPLSSPTPFDASQADYNIPCRYKYKFSRLVSIHFLQKLAGRLWQKIKAFCLWWLVVVKIFNSSNLSKDDVLMLFGKKLMSVIEEN